MQPNSITLAVDHLNNGTTTDHVIDRMEEAPNRSLYFETATHTMSARRQVALYRTFPKASGNFKGVQKSAFKMTYDLTVLGIDGTNLTAPAIIEVSFSVPVGVDAFSSKFLRQYALALLDYDTVMAPLNDLCMV